jgi:hypothetical protein
VPELAPAQSPDRRGDPSESPRHAWVVDYSDQLGHRHLKTFARKRDADVYHAQVTVDVGAGIHTAGSRSITVTRKLCLTSREAAGVERATLINYREHLDLHITPLIGATELAALSVPSTRIKTILARRRIACKLGTARRPRDVGLRMRGEVTCSPNNSLLLR